MIMKLQGPLCFEPVALGQGLESVEEIPKWVILNFL